jgi:putative DNA primase/helicase
MKLPIPGLTKPWEKSNKIVNLYGKYLNSSRIRIVNGNPRLSHALHYASLGLPVFPAHSMVERRGDWKCSCQLGLDCPASAKHPRTQIGLKEATTARHLIFDWWCKWPDANVGLLTGRKSGFFVVDIDPKYGGDEALEDLQNYYKSLYKEDYDPLPKTLIANTGSGGQHIFFEYPVDVSIKGSVSEIGIGIDIRSDGNYIIAPPSNHKSERSYSWVWSDTQIEYPPDWLIAAILEADDNVETEILPGTQGSKITGEIIGERRNEFLFKYGCGYVNSHPRDALSKRLREINDGLCSPPLEISEVNKIIKGIERNYRSKRNKKST